MTANISSTSSTSMATTTIYLNASELAVVVGENPYQNIRDLIIKLWSKYFMTDYSKMLDNIQKVNKVKIIQETEYECLNRLVAKYKPEIKEKVAECLKSTDTKNLKTNQTEILKDLKKTNISVEDKEILEKTLKSLSNKSFGTRKEKDAITQYEEMTKKKVQRIGKYFTTVIDISNISNRDSFPKFVWGIGGKIDGLTEDGEIIEVKNRVRDFFYEVRDYENVQIQTYLKLLNIKNGYLVESLVKTKGMQPEINIINVEFDEKYWKDVVIPRVEKFIEFFYHIMADNEYKMRLLLQKEVAMEREIKRELFRK